MREKLQALFWSPKGFSRPFRYMAFRILRINATPHMVAAGFGIGVASAFTPLIGLHLVLSVAGAWLVRGSVVAATLGTVIIGNPVTYPFIWAGTWEVGRIMMGTSVAHSGPGPDLHALFAHFDFASIWKPVLEPMLLGSAPLALGLGVMSYILVFKGADWFQKRRQHRLAARATGMDTTGSMA